MTEFQENDASWLLQYRRKITSQFGEDGVIEKIFKTIGEGKRWCVEFGAGNGKYRSNTWNLIANCGWSGVEIESNYAEYKELIKNHSAHNIFSFNTLVSFREPDSLDSILKRTSIPRNFDFLCIDVDGNDYHIWESLKGYEPRVVMIEYNKTIPADIVFIQPRDMSIRWGSSLAAMVKLGKTKGYELVYAYSVNAIFVKREYFSSFGIRNNSPAAFLKDRGIYTRFFQLYDGSIVLYGYKSSKLISRERRIQRNPVWFLTESELLPVRFRYENKFLLRCKEIVSVMPFYNFFSRFKKLL